MQISPECHSLIMQALATLDGWTIPPMPQVERSVYDEFEEIVKRLRGKWKRGKGHVFPYDPRIALEAVALTWEAPAKNPLAYFPTPQNLCTELVGLLRTPRRALEPSAGDGNFVEAMRVAWPLTRITAVELDPLNVAMLRKRMENVKLPDWYDRRICGRPGETEIIEGSFTNLETCPQDPLFDCVVMNPPFTVDGDQNAWFTHFKLAWNLLVDGGQILCIAPTGWKWGSSKAAREIRDFMYSIGATTFELEDQAFKESGTLVKTLVITVDKASEADYTEEHNHYPSFYAWRGWLHIDCDKTLCERLRKLTHLQADSFEIQEFMREALRACCDSGDGVPVTDRVVAQMLEHWEDWKSW